MTSKELFIACQKRLPVIFQRPNEKAIACEHVIEVVFEPLQGGRWRCSGILPDSSGHSSIRAWCGHISLPKGIELSASETEVL